MFDFNTSAICLEAKLVPDWDEPTADDDLEGLDGCLNLPLSPFSFDVVLESEDDLVFDELCGVVCSFK